MLSNQQPNKQSSHDKAQQTCIVPDMFAYFISDRLISLVIKASTSRVENPGGRILLALGFSWLSD